VEHGRRPVVAALLACCCTAGSVLGLLARASVRCERRLGDGLCGVLVTRYVRSGRRVQRASCHLATGPLPTFEDGRCRCRLRIYAWPMVRFRA